MRAIGDDAFYVTETEDRRPEHRTTWRVEVSRLGDYADEIAPKM